MFTADEIPVFLDLTRCRDEYGSPVCGFPWFSRVFEANAGIVTLHHRVYEPDLHSFPDAIETDNADNVVKNINVGASTLASTNNGFPLNHIRTNFIAYCGG